MYPQELYDALHRFNNIAELEGHQPIPKSHQMAHMARLTFVFGNPERYSTLLPVRALPESSPLAITKIEVLVLLSA